MYLRLTTGFTVAHSFALRARLEFLMLTRIVFAALLLAASRTQMTHADNDPYGDPLRRVRRRGSAPSVWYWATTLRH